MQLSNAQIEILERAGNALCKPSEAAKLAGIPLESFKGMLLDEESPAYVAYFSGFETTKLELKESIVALARQGSSPAQNLALTMLQQSELELDEE